MTLLLGGTGFVGRHVTRRLAAASHSVTVLHRGTTTPSLPESTTKIPGPRDDRTALRSALDTRRLRTELAFAEPIAYAEALTRTMAGEPAS